MRTGLGLRSLMLAIAAGAMMTCGAQGAGDAKKGAETFVLCEACHTAEKGAPNGVGPNLYRIVGRKAASLPDFYYSSALKASHIVWTPDKLKAWVLGPQKLVPGTRMTFGGLSDSAKADDLVAYLETLK